MVFVRRRCNGRHLAARPRQQELAPIEIEVQVSRRRRVDAADAGNGTQGVGDLLGDRFRRFAQRAGELKRDRDRQIAHGPAGRHLDSEGRNLGQAERPADRVGDGVVYVALNAENHEWSSTVRGLA